MHTNTLHYTAPDKAVPFSLQCDLNRSFGFTIGQSMAFADNGFGEFEQVNLVSATDWVHDGLVNAH